MNEETAPAEDDAALPDYAGPVQRRRFRRIKLGLLLSSMAACLGVTLLGFICTAMLSNILGLSGASMNYELIGSNSLMGGVSLGFQLASINFLLFFITVPAAWLALGLSIGRLPYRGIVNRKPFLRWGAIWGAILVGGTTGGFGLLVGPLQALGALVSGGLIGAVAGLGCGLLFYAIVKPANQLADVDVNVF